jgi:hypothetical protein
MEKSTMASISQFMNDFDEEVQPRFGWMETSGVKAKLELLETGSISLLSVKFRPKARGIEISSGIYL